jgi:DNA primase
MYPLSAGHASPLLNKKSTNGRNNNNNNNNNLCCNCKNHNPVFKSAGRSKRDNLDWDDLGEKIEDWFEQSKTPEQKVVYRFLKDIKNEDDERNIRSAMSNPSSNVSSDKAQSLEDILDNLKKYRSKFNRKNSRAQSSQLPKIANKDLLNMSTENLKNNFESSTWRVMRHLRSADIRNKYPLPKANPDYHFRNATTFYVAGRPPKSTFLLHPDWV